MDKKSLETPSPKLVVTVEFDGELKAMLLHQCEVEDRTMAGMVRVICKRFFADQMFAADFRPRPGGDTPSDLPYFHGELPESKRGAAD